MLSQLRKRIRPANLNPSAEEILLRASALFGAEQAKDLRSVIAEKVEDLRHYDVRAMDRALAILTWGRAGSLLLASYSTDMTMSSCFLSFAARECTISFTATPRCRCAINCSRTRFSTRSRSGFSKAPSPSRPPSIMPRYRRFLSTMVVGPQSSWSHAGLSFCSCT